MVAAAVGIVGVVGIVDGVTTTVLTVNQLLYTHFPCTAEKTLLFRRHDNPRSINVLAFTNITDSIFTCCGSMRIVQTNTKYQEGKNY